MKRLFIFRKVSIFQQTTTPMNNDYRSPSFKRWLDKLQQESWQLELIISGFAIYALILAYEPLKVASLTAKEMNLDFFHTMWEAVTIIWGILIFNLILHVILRGLWIGAVGLRYVSGDIDYNALKYSKQFTTYLKKNVGSFDKYIGQLEKYCSVLFAISFLSIFYTLSLFIFILILAAVAYLIFENPYLSGIMWVEMGFSVGLTIFILLSIIVFIDFIGQGILKKNKWIAKIYFPIYWLFSYLTLSFLYRPIIYNFLDNKFGKRIVFLLLPLYIITSFLFNIDFKHSNYLANKPTSLENYASSYNYEDLMLDNKDFIKTASIPSKIIKENYLKVFILFKKNIEDQIFKKNEALKPKFDQRGISFSNIKIQTKNHLNELDYLSTFKELYYIQIDSLRFSSDYIITTDKHKRLGFETYLNIRDLNEGKHILRILAPAEDSTQVENDTLVTIPFWHFKD